MAGFADHPDVTGVEEGGDWVQSRLLPSFQDRQTYYSLVVTPALAAKLPVQQVEEQGANYQAAAKQLFTRRLEAELRDGPDEKAEFLCDATWLLLDRMGVTYCEILTEVNMAQVFLWLQEKSLFGEASLLHNPAPGIFFTAVDMVRNLLLAPTMDLNLADQASSLLFQIKTGIQHPYHCDWLPVVCLAC